MVKWRVANNKYKYSIQCCPCGTYGDFYDCLREVITVMDVYTCSMKAAERVWEVGIPNSSQSRSLDLHKTNEKIKLDQSWRDSKLPIITAGVQYIV